MKKVFLYIIVIMILMFLLPIVFTSKFVSVQITKQQNESKNDIQNITPYNYKKYGTINIINEQTNEITKIGLDEYLLRCCFCRNACGL